MCLLLSAIDLFFIDNINHITSIRVPKPIDCFGIRVITKLPNSEQSYKGKVKTPKYINRQNQSTGKEENV
jgi:hypothetical protein